MSWSSEIAPEVEMEHGLLPQAPLLASQGMAAKGARGTAVLGAIRAWNGPITSHTSPYVHKVIVEAQEGLRGDPFPLGPLYLSREQHPGPLPQPLGALQVQSGAKRSRREVEVMKVRPNRRCRGRALCLIRFSVLLSNCHIHQYQRRYTASRQMWPMST